MRNPLENSENLNPRIEIEGLENNPQEIQSHGFLLALGKKPNEIALHAGNPDQNYQEIVSKRQVVWSDVLHIGRIYITHKGPGGDLVIAVVTEQELDQQTKIGLEEALLKHYRNNSQEQVIEIYFDNTPNIDHWTWISD